MDREDDRSCLRLKGYLCCFFDDADPGSDVLQDLLVSGRAVRCHGNTKVNKHMKSAGKPSRRQLLT